MIKKILLAFFAMVYLNETYAITDTTIFVSDFEKKIFIEFLETRKVEPIEFFMSINDNKQDIKNQLKVFYSNLEAKNIVSLKNKKKIKIIFDAVHDNFLKKYNAETYFNDIFETGEYNCVSASALYSLVLNYFNIDYIIKETPTHVYLLADPKNSIFLIETTLPNNGVFYFDDKFKRSYIEYLHDNKILSETEFKSKPLADLFNEYYINDETIDLYELAGLQYYNKGVFAYNSEDYYTSLKNFEKAEILYSSDKIRFMKSSAIGNILNIELLNKKFRGNLLAKYINCNSQNTITLKYCEDYFDNVSNEMVINHPDIEKYILYYNELIQNIKDSVNLNNIYQSFYSFKGYYEYSNYNYYGALLEFEMAYNYNNSNIRTKQFISEVALKYFANEDNYEAGIDSLTMYIQKFPFLINDRMLQKYLVYCYAQIIGNSFQYENDKKGIDYLNKFEQLSIQIKDLKVDGEYAGYLYGQVASYYYKKNEFNTAEKYLLKGLELSPNSAELNQRLNSFKESSNYLNGYTGKFSSQEKINQAISKAKSNKTITNANVSKYLIGRWELEFLTVDGKIEKAMDETSIIMNLLKSKSLILSMGKDHQTGEWFFDDNSCSLKLKESKGGGIMNLIIFEINENKIIGAFYSNENQSDFMEVTFKSIK